jgi:hypothetical protein
MMCKAYRYRMHSIAWHEWYYIIDMKTLLREVLCYGVAPEGVKIVQEDRYSKYNPFRVSNTLLHRLNIDKTAD